MFDKDSNEIYDDSEELNENPFGAKLNIKPQLAPLYAQAYAVIPNWDNLMSLYTDFFAIVDELDIIRQQIVDNLNSVTYNAPMIYGKREYKGYAYIPESVDKVLISASDLVNSKKALLAEIVEHRKLLNRLGKSEYTEW